MFSNPCISPVNVPRRWGINLDAVAEAISVLKEHLYSLGPQREFDTARNLHLLNLLLMMIQKRSAGCLRAIHPLIKTALPSYSSRHSATSGQYRYQRFTCASGLPFGMDVYAKTECWILFCDRTGNVVHEEQLFKCF